jgi:gliding motility-associated-like protein
MLRKLILFFVVLFSFNQQASASHIIGGEIYYDCLGGNLYKITLKVYRNCYDSDSPMDDPAYLFIFNSSGNFIDSLAIPLPGTIILPSLINNPCFTPPNNVCVEQAIYQRTIYLPPLAGGYDISYQRCCRDNSLINLDNPGLTGSAYVTHIPDPAIAVCNNSPRFSSHPPIFICNGLPLNYDHSATDPDNDSLYYEFCSPLNGAEPLCPQYGPQGPLSPCSEIGPAPPYSPVAWTPGYSAAYPINSSPALTINHQTGQITGTPNTIGQFVATICVSEYRNGSLIGTSRRDFLFNVIPCQGLPLASIPQQTTFCFGYQAHFTQTSYYASTLFWDFGDPLSTSDISYASSPGYTYPGPGTYTVTLIINKGTPCADTATTTVDIRHNLAPDFVIPAGKCFFNNSYDFSAAGDFQGNGTFTWNFGTHASPSVSNTPNVTGVVFDTTGSFPVTLTISENGCVKKDSGNVDVYAKPVADYGIISPYACQSQPLHFIDSSTSDAPLTYQWSFGDGHTSTDANPYHPYNSLGSYLTGLIINTTHGCADTFQLPTAINVYPVPSAGFDVTPKDTSIFYPEITFTDQSIGAEQCFIYWGDEVVYDHCDSMHRYSKPGTYRIMQVVINTSGCNDTAYAEVIIRPEFMFWIPNAFTPGDENGMNDVFQPKIIGVHDYYFMIFNRWGEKVFETKNPAEGWNGYSRGTLDDSEVYVYKIVFRDDVRNDPHEYMGHFTLIK